MRLPLQISEYIEENIAADYDSLVKALNNAIDKEAQNKGNEFITDTKNEFKIEELDFDTVMEEFNTIVGGIINSNSKEDMETVWTPKITQITEKYLGKGKKASQCTRDQVEMLNLIVLDLKELVK